MAALPREVRHSSELQRCRAGGNQRGEGWRHGRRAVAPRIPDAVAGQNKNLARRQIQGRALHLRVVGRKSGRADVDGFVVGRGAEKVCPCRPVGPNDKGRAVAHPRNFHVTVAFHDRKYESCRPSARARFVGRAYPCDYRLGSVPDGNLNCRSGRGNCGLSGAVDRPQAVRYSEGQPLAPDGPGVAVLAGLAGEAVPHAGHARGPKGAPFGRPPSGAVPGS